jgi:hypothetical protein
VRLKRRAAARHNHRIGRLAAFLLLLTAALTTASTPEAWAAYDQEVAKACIAASSLSYARPAGARVDFDDSVGYSALLLVGHYPQPQMKNQAGRELCLFDKRSRRAVIAEADSLIIRKGATAPLEH